MHAYLLIGTGEGLERQAQRLTRELKASFMEFPLRKIEDVRSLSRFSRLSLTRAQTIYIKGIDEATHEAQNAFLKALEEPQDNLYYILTANTAGKVLPTIVSRCQVIAINRQLPISNEDVEEFNNLSLIERLKFVDKFRKREEAKTFLANIIDNWHQKLVKEGLNQQKLAWNLKRAVSSLYALGANGNVLLQLTNFVITLN